MSHRRAFCLPTAERAEIISHSEIGASLDDETLALLADSSSAVEFRRRRFIYRAGDVADSLYVIARGRVKICSIDDVTAREAVIDIVGAGAVFGESSLYSAREREELPFAYDKAQLLPIPSGVTGPGMPTTATIYATAFA